MNRLNITSRKYVAEYEIKNVEFSSGQEPDASDLDFATTFDVEFIIKGKDLSRLLGVQERVLEVKLKKIDSKQAIKLLSSNVKIQKELDSLVEKKIKKEFRNYFMSEVSNMSGFKFDTVELGTDDTHYWTANVDTKNNLIKFSVIYDVTGEFME